MRCRLVLIVPTIAGLLGCSSSDTPAAPARTAAVTSTVSQPTTTAAPPTTAAPTAAPTTTAAPAPVVTIARDTALALTECIRLAGNPLAESIARKTNDTSGLDEISDACTPALDLLTVDGDFPDLNDHIALKMIDINIFAVHVLDGSATQEDVDEFIQGAVEWSDTANALLDEALGH